MEFGHLMIDILVDVSCKFEMYIFKIAQVINENVRIAFLYVPSVFCILCPVCENETPSSVWDNLNNIFLDKVITRPLFYFENNIDTQPNMIMIQKAT